MFEYIEVNYNRTRLHFTLGCLSPEQLKLAQVAQLDVRSLMARSPLCTHNVEEFLLFKHILLPTDGSELSESAIRTGVHLAKAIGARVTGLTVIPGRHRSDEEGLESEPGVPPGVEGRLLFVKHVANGNGIDCDAMLTRGDSPSEEIIPVAEELDCDLIIMASHGRKGLEELLLGSETRAVLAHGRLPVLVCR